MDDSDERHQEYVKLCEARFRKLYGTGHPSPEEYRLLSEGEQHKVWAATLSTRWFEEFKLTIDGVMRLTDLTRTEAIMLYFGTEMLVAKNWITSLTKHEDEHKEPWQ